MSDYSHLVGHRFPGGRVTAHAHLAWLWADAAEAEQRPGVLHPGVTFLLCYEGIGVTIAEILALAGETPDGPTVAGGNRVVFERPLRPDTVYDVTGGIVSVERKEGRRAGVFDRLTFEASLSEADTGEHVLTNYTTWILPRKDG